MGVSFARIVAIGFAAGAAWAILHWALTFPMTIAWAALLAFPLCEEIIRLGLLSWLWRQPATHEQVYAGFAFGMGFGLIEASLRWWDATLNPNSTVFGFIGPIVPLLLHITLGAIAWRFVANQRAVIGLAVCFALHTLHNAFVVYVLMRTPGETAVAVTIGLQILIYAGAISALWASRRRARRSAPPRPA